MRTKDIMTRDVVTCTQDDTLSHAAQLMWNYDIGCVPVVDGSGKVVGMLTDRDICMAAYTQDRAPSQLRVDGAMARMVHSCNEDDSLEAAEALMRDHRIRRLPVTDWTQRLVGVLSLNDIARCAQVKADTSPAGASAASLALTLVAVSQPRVTEVAGRG